jgi:putative phosphoesterase
VSAATSSSTESVPSAPTRVAIISDTHFPRKGRTLRPDVVERLRAADAIVHAGDLCDRAALRELEAIGPPVHAVLGNNDHELQGDLPLRRTLTVGGVRVGIVHDGGTRTGRLERLRRTFPEHDAVVFGHSHVPLHEQADDGFQIFNPGSATDHRGRWPVHTMGELVVADGRAAFTLIELPG